MCFLWGFSLHHGSISYGKLSRPWNSKASPHHHKPTTFLTVMIWCYWVKNYSIRNTQAFPLSPVLALHQIYSMSFPYPFCQCQYRFNLWISTFDWSVHKNILPKDLEGHQSVLWQMLDKPIFSSSLEVFFSCITPVDFCSLADCRTFVFLNSLRIDSHSL